MAIETRDEYFMDRALEAADEAGRLGEVPIGAVLVHEGEIVAVTANRRERDHDPTAHAEVLALRIGGRVLGSWRLTECTLYVTLEPCPMCMGACINARVGRLVFACRDQKAGAAVSCYQMGTDDLLNHRIVITEGVRQRAASHVLTSFFASLRSRGRRPVEEAPVGMAPSLDAPSLDTPSLDTPSLAPVKLPRFVAPEVANSPVSSPLSANVAQLDR